MKFPKPEKKLKRPRRVSPISAAYWVRYRKYQKLRQEFIAGKTCERCRKSGRLEVHHKEGRDGNRLLDVNTWAALCRQCHVWVHAHPRAAYETGLLTKDFGVKK